MGEWTFEQIVRGQQATEIANLGSPSDARCHKPPYAIQTDKCREAGLLDTNVDLEKPASIVGWCTSEVDGVYEGQRLIHDVVKFHDDGCAEGINDA